MVLLVTCAGGDRLAGEMRSAAAREWEEIQEGVWFSGIG